MTLFNLNHVIQHAHDMADSIRKRIQDRIEWVGPLECPICEQEKLYVALSGNYDFKCFGKHEHLRGHGEKEIISEVFSLIGVYTIADAKRYIQAYTKKRYRPKEPEIIATTLSLKKALNKFPDLEITKSAYDYCSWKWIPESQFDKIFIGFDYRDNPRLYLPFWGYEDGKMIYKGYQARLILNVEGVAKTLTPGVNKLETLFNIHQANKQKEVVMVWESPFDTPITPPASVAIFGTHLAPKQAQQLLRFKNIVICFDGDAIDKAKKYVRTINENHPEVGIDHVWYLDIDSNLQIDDMKYDFIDATVINQNGQAKPITDVCPIEYIHPNGNGNWKEN